MKSPAFQFYVKDWRTDANLRRCSPAARGIAAYQADQGAKKMASYWELLKDPRWQKVRLKKLESAEWKCQSCYDDGTTLSVHHKRYVKGRQPWEYEDHELTVLCQPCHEIEHEAKDQRSDLISRLHQDGPASAADFFAVGAGYISSQTNDAGLSEAAESFYREMPYQFACGHLLAAFERHYRMSHDGILLLAAAIQEDQEVAREIGEALSKHGLIRKGAGES